MLADRVRFPGRMKSCHKFFLRLFNLIPARNNPITYSGALPQAQDKKRPIKSLIFCKMGVWKYGLLLQPKTKSNSLESRPLKGQVKLHGPLVSVFIMSRYLVIEMIIPFQLVSSGMLKGQGIPRDLMRFYQIRYCILGFVFNGQFTKCQIDA